VTLNVNRQKDNIQEALSAGGEIALKVGYLGTTATLTIDDTPCRSPAPVEPEATSASASRTSRRSATWPRSSTARPATKPMSARRSSASFRPRRWTTSRPIGICSTFGEEPGRVKIDGYRFFNKVGESTLVQLQDAAGTVLQAGSGLPQPVATLTYLAGGAKGVTTDADVTAASPPSRRCAATS
jgi:hypothetical protein